MPELMFEHGIDAKKGWFHMAALDFDAHLSTNVTFDVPRGRVVHVNSVGQFEMGVHATGVAIFLLNGKLDFDVSNPGVTTLGNFMHKAIAPTGKMSGLVATGGYELDSTEFDVDQTYPPGDLLTAVASNSNATTGGRLTNQSAVQYTNAICGVVSTGKHQNHNGIWTLSFWTVWLPAAP